MPINEFVVVGSGLLDVLNIRTAEDIDIVASKKLFDLMKDSGWKVSLKYDETYLRKADCEVWLLWDSPSNKPNFDELFADNNVINGIHFISLQWLYDWKSRRGRPKDLSDLRLIDAYREN